MSSLGKGLVGLFKQWGKGIGKAADNLLLNADARKAISDEVISKYKPRIELARKAGSRRADNIKDLDTKLTESKKALTDAQKDWQAKYDSALADAKNQRQTDIDKYNAQSKKYDDALADANASRQSIFDKLADDEDNYDQFHTIFTDVNTGERFIYNNLSGERVSLTKAYKRATPKEVRNLNKALQGYDNRLYDSKSDKVINAFDEYNKNTYQGKDIFDRYYSNKISTHNADIRDAEKQIQQAYNDQVNWTANNRNPPQAWDDSVERQFTRDFKKNNAKPTYSFNGQNYSKESELEKAYKDALAREQKRQDLYSKTASGYVSKRDAEIAQRIQDAKDMKKAKLFLGGTLGAGALYAGAKAMYGGDDTDNSETPDNIDTTDNTYTGEPDPELKAEKTLDGKDALNGRPLKIDANFNPDKAAAVLAKGAYDQGVEDGNSIESSDDHIIDDDGLYELLKAMEDPHKADAVANYIYSKHGDDLEVQNLGWRGWLNKYYGDLLRSRMNLDPSSYKGMHISGGL